MEAGWTVAYVLCVFLGAGMVKGVIGMGLPAIGMGLLSLVMSPAQAASVMLLSLVLTNVWQMLAGPYFLGLVRRLWPFLFTVVVGTLLGSGWLASAHGKTGAGVLGVMIAIYGISGLMDFRMTATPASERWLSPLLGLIAGLINAATAVFSIPAVPYLRAIGLEKDELVQALGLAFTVAAVALGINLTLAAELDAGDFKLAIAGLGAATLGMVIGQKVRGRLDPATFRRWFFVGLTLLGCYLAVRNLI